MAKRATDIDSLSMVPREHALSHATEIQSFHCALESIQQHRREPKSLKKKEEKIVLSFLKVGGNFPSRICFFFLFLTEISLLRLTFMSVI